MNITRIYKPSSTSNILHRFVCKVQMLLPVQNWTEDWHKESSWLEQMIFWQHHHASSDWGIESQEWVDDERETRKKRMRWVRRKHFQYFSNNSQNADIAWSEAGGEVSHRVLLSDIVLTTKSGKNHTFTHVTLCLTVVNSYDEIGIRNIWVVLV